MNDDKKVLETKAIVDDSDFRKKMTTMSAEMNGFANKMSSGFKEVGDNISKGVTRLKWFGFALFGVYSMYHFLAKASLAYLSQDTETNNKIKAAWIGLGAIFASLLEKIADFAIKAVSYINVFVKALTGVDFIARASAKSLDKTTKSTKALKNALTGIDEITNIDIKTGGAKDVADTSWIDEFNKVDLNPNMVKFFENLGTWARGLKDMGSELLIIAGILAGMWAVLRVAEIIRGFTTISSAVSGVVSWLGKLNNVLGVGTVLIGIGITIKGIIDYIKHPSWDNFLTILLGISVAVAGIALVMGGWVLALGAGIGVVATLIGKMIIQNTTTGKLKDSTKELVKSKERLKQIEEELTKATDDYIYAVDRTNEATRRLLELEKEHKQSGQELYEQVQRDGVESYKNLTTGQQDLYKAYVDTLKAQENEKLALENLTVVTEAQTKEEKNYEEQKRKMLDLAKENKKAIKLEGDQFTVYKDAIVEAFNKGEISASEARTAIEKAMAGMSKSAQTTFKSDLPSAIQEGLNPDKYKSWGKKLGDWFSGLWNGIFGKKTMEVEISGGKLGGGGGGGGFAKGLQEVPHDMMALVHKGEAIVPARFNKDSYFNGGQAVVDNSEVVQAINMLNETLREKNMTVNIDKDAIGSASVDYINDQKRILGRGLI